MKEFKDLTQDELEAVKVDLTEAIEDVLKEKEIEVLTNPDYNHREIIWISIDAREIAKIAVEGAINKEEILDEQEFIHPTEEEIEDMQREFDRDHGGLL